MTQKNQNFEMFAGDTKDIVVTVDDGDGIPVNLTGASIKWVLKKATVTGAQQVLKTMANGIFLTDPLAGEFTVRLATADTNAISGKFYHEAEVTDSSGNVSTVFTGTVKIEPSGV